jgi:hypothetical protein
MAAIAQMQRRSNAAPLTSALSAINQQFTHLISEETGSNNGV